MLLLFLLLPMILAVLHLQGTLEKKYVVWIMMMAVTLLLYQKYLPQTLQILKKIYGFSDNNTTPKKIIIDPALIHVNREYHNQEPSSYMGYPYGWVDAAFGSASGGSKKQATIPKWTPPTPDFYGN